MSVALIFQSTHPLRGATVNVRVPLQCWRDFNPRTPCGVRPRTFCKPLNHALFQSTHPLRGATSYRLQRRPCCRYFNPRTPCGVRRYVLVEVLSGLIISIHAPLAGCDGSLHSAVARSPAFQSTHPLRGATFGSKPCLFSFILFQSTHPLRGATISRTKSFRRSLISIHAPLAGCDYKQRGFFIMTDFISIHAPLAGCDTAHPSSLFR